MKRSPFRPTPHSLFHATLAVAGRIVRTVVPGPRCLLQTVAVAVGLLQLTVSLVAAEAPGSERIPLWTQSPPLGAGPAVDGNAFVTVFRPENPNGTIVLICPGGGYGGLVTDAEGSGIARWLNRHGITGVVLEYRLPRGNPDLPLLDAQRAIRWARSQAVNWACATNRIGIMGFSAGGHLAALAATRFDHGNPGSANAIERQGSRPDFAVLVYPVVSLDDPAHGGIRQNMFGQQAVDAARLKAFACDALATEQSAPMFLAHARNDRGVSPQHSRRLHQALRGLGVASRYLELPYGDHGLNGYQGPMWDAWQSGSLQWLADLKLIPAADVAGRGAAASAITFPTHAQLASGPQQVSLLPGSPEFVFTLYGVPSEAATVESLVDVLRTRRLGNGFDPGPGPSRASKPVMDFLAANGWPVVFYSGGEMQIKGGRAVFGPAEESALAAFDRNGVFCAFQLGEWGYYFHNLSFKEAWWRDVYGADYEAFKHLKKPAGLAGYDRMPESRRECYETLKDYFQSRSRDLLGRVISVTGHSHYEAYAAEWGARCVGLEVGENIAFTQSKLAFARGAARQWRKPWSVQVSPWFGPTCTTAGPLRKEGKILYGLDAGHSLSFYERMWLHAWFAGAAMVTPENSIAIFFEKPEAPWTLTSHGRKAAEVFDLTTTHTRGIPYTPVAVVLDHYAGYNGYMNKPWGILKPTSGDQEIADLFDHQLYPGGNHIHYRPDMMNLEASYLRATPYGEIFDVLHTGVPPEVLPTYPVILLAGDIQFDDAFLSELEKSLRRGSRVLMAQRHKEALGTAFERLNKQGRLEVLEPWKNPASARMAAISNDRLEAIAREQLPFKITGDPVQYAVNRTPQGWVVELIHNGGVIKNGPKPVEIDPKNRARVTLEPRFRCQQIKRWRTPQTFDSTERIEVEIGPGAVDYIEFVEPPPNR